MIVVDTGILLTAISSTDRHHRESAALLATHAGQLVKQLLSLQPPMFQGIRATATDADWSAGDGLEVTGPVEALVLTLAGRFAALDQLQGEGMATLRTRADAL